MIAINHRYACWQQVTLQGGVTEALAKNLLQAMDFEVISLTDAEAEVLTQGEVSLTELCHHKYLHGEFFNEDIMEWVSCDEISSMLLFGGSIIMTSCTVERDDNAGTFKDVVRWFGCRQFTLTHEDIQ